jgi:hypothetical protein
VYAAVGAASAGFKALKAVDGSVPQYTRAR